MNHDKLAETILETYLDDTLSAELVIYRTKGDQIIRDTIIIDFGDDGDYQYSTHIKPIYTE